MALLWVGFGMAATIAIASVLVAARAGRARSDLARAFDRMRDELAERLAATESERSDREAILAALQEGILLVDQDGSVVYQNERARELLGGAVARVRDPTPSVLREILDSDDTSSASVEFEMASTRRRLLASAGPISRGGRTLVVLRDVTQARLVDAIRRDFAANASHELKTPSASIQALAETIVDAALHDPAAVPGFAAQLQSEAFRLSRVVSDLLDLSRLEGGMDERTEVRLDRVVEGEAERCRAGAEDAGLQMTVQAGEPVIVVGSARDLALLARNLVENAIQYTRPGGSIGVEVRARDGEALLDVRDTGLGIPTKDRGRIFERFYRVDRARSRETGGTGLGLSIVKHVAENHGGTVEVDSELGKGSTFTVRLPLAPAPS